MAARTCQASCACSSNGRPRARSAEGRRAREPAGRLRGMLERRTKIVATLGPATDPPGVLDQLVAAGMDCARLNCSHGDADELRRRAAEVRAAAGRAGRPLGLLFDLQGPKLRLSADTVERRVQAGDEIVVHRRRWRRCRPRARRFPWFVAPCDGTLGDRDRRRRPAPRGPAVGAGEVVARAVARARWPRARGSTSPTRDPSCRRSPPRTSDDLRSRSSSAPTSSRCRSCAPAADVEELRSGWTSGLARADGGQDREGRGLREPREIIAVADGVMVARGDYGVEAGVARVPLMQKDTITAPPRRESS